MKKEDLKSLTASILEARSNTKKIPDLIEKLEDESVAKTALNCILKVFTTLVKRGDLRAATSKEKQNSNDAAVKYSKWLLDVFEETFCKIANILESASDKSFSDLAISTYMKLLVIGHDSEESKSWTSSDVKRLKLIIETLLSSEYDCQVQIERFREYLEYPDSQTYIIQTLARCKRKTSPSFRYRQNYVKFVEILNYKGKIENGPGLILDTFEVPAEAVTKNFDTIWQELGKMQHKEVELYKRILILLTEKVIAVLSNPLSFTDFLMESYNVGGSISLLALNGVFILITKHHLEYPDFYKKLYALCTPELLHAKYRARFFHLANLFLASSHLPEYLVAAFVKRLSRMCLSAPPNSILLMMPFIGNLLLRHKGLQKMIDNTEEHYIMDEPDPAQSKAVESGLWEIKTLQNHVLPQVAQAAKFINKPLPQMEWNIDEYLEITEQEMFEKEARKKVFVNVPLTFERPIGCAFPKNDLLSKHFVIG